MSKIIIKQTSAKYDKSRSGRYIHTRQVASQLHSSVQYANFSILVYCGPKFSALIPQSFPIYSKCFTTKTIIVFP